MYGQEKCANRRTSSTICKTNFYGRLIQTSNASQYRIVPFGFFVKTISLNNTDRHIYSYMYLYNFIDIRNVVQYSTAKEHIHGTNQPKRFTRIIFYRISSVLIRLNIVDDLTLRFSQRIEIYHY